MDVIFCSDKNEWNRFVVQNSNSFLQSFEWGDFQKKPENIFRLRVVENEQVLIQAQIFKESFSSKRYLYIPFGPVVSKDITNDKKQLALGALLSKIKELAVKENCIFLRIEPVTSLGDLSKYKTNNPPRRIQPQKTLIIDLTKSEEELLKDFSSTTRHNIKRAEKSGVMVRELNEYSPEFYKLLAKTKDRQEFGVYSEEHYINLFKINSDFIKAKLFLAEYESKIVNATIVLIFNNRAITLHSGSDYNYRNVKGTNILKWEIMRSAKRNGLKDLDMWGIDEKKWPNLTAFKKGFGGKEFEYPLGVDIVFQSFWYNVYKIIRFIRRII